VQESERRPVIDPVQCAGGRVLKTRTWAPVNHAILANAPESFASSLTKSSKAKSTL